MAKHSDNEIHLQFEKFQIHNVKNYMGWQKVLCPRCSHTRKKREDPILAVNFYEGAVRCHHCGWHLNIWGHNGEKEGLPRFQAVKPYNQKTINDSGLEYLTTVRCLTRDVIKRNNIEYMAYKDKETGVTKSFIAFNYYFASTLAYVKYRSRDKKFLSAKGGTQVFYKINDIFDADECIITEGEIDALSYEVAGFKNAISIPGGAPNPDDSTMGKKFDFLERCLPYMSHIKKYYISVDNDINGRFLQKELIRRLGKQKCWIVNLPSDCKDSNDVLMKYGVSKLRDLLESAEPVKSSGIYTISDFAQEFFELRENGYEDGVITGIGDFDKLFSFHKGQLTVVSGIPGSGKSTFMDFVSMQLALKNKWKIGMYTPENQKVIIHGHRLAEMLIGKPLLQSWNQMTETELAQAIDFIDNVIKYLFPDDLTSLDELMESIDYMSKVYNIDMFIIDPWNTIAHNIARGDTETTYTAKALNKLKYQARELNIHTVIVAHPTKMDEIKPNQFRVPNLYDISGSANWFNVVDNGIIVHRTETNQADIYIKKIKHGFMGSTGKASLNFSRENQRYFDTQEDIMGNYLIEYDYV